MKTSQLTYDLSNLHSAQEIKAKGGYVDAKEFFEYLSNKVTVNFVPKVKEEGLESFELDVNRKIVYDQLATRVGEYLHVVPTHLRFTTVTSNGNPRTAVKRSELTLAQILASANMTSTVTPQSTLLYEVLDLSLSELETKKNQKLIWLPEGISKEEQLEFLVPKQGQLQDLLPLMKEKLKLEDADLEKIRFFEANGGKLQKLLPLEHAVAGIPEFMRLFAEKVPEDEVAEADTETAIISAFHFHKEPAKVHREGVPFQFVVKNVRHPNFKTSFELTQSRARYSKRPARGYRRERASRGSNLRRLSLRSCQRPHFRSHTTSRMVCIAAVIAEMDANDVCRGYTLRAPSARRSPWT